MPTVVRTIGIWDPEVSSFLQEIQIRDDTGNRQGVRGLETGAEQEVSLPEGRFRQKKSYYYKTSVNWKTMKYMNIRKRLKN